MKIIFLDFDGVLSVCFGERDEFGSLFHPEFVENLRRIVEATDAKIVISSSWRADGLEVMKALWEKRNMPGELIGITAYSEAKVRGVEIQAYLDSLEFQRINWSIEVQRVYLEASKCKNYVILDDDSDMLYTQREHYVCCSHPEGTEGSIERYGLTREAAVRAIRILNSNLIDLYYPKVNSEKNFDKANSTHQRELNRLKKSLSLSVKANRAKKIQLIKINELIKSLLEQKRITKDELKPYFIRKKEILNSLL